jgi:triacylglycerol lipase
MKLIMAALTVTSAFLSAQSLASTPTLAAEHVVLLHGLARSASSMTSLSKALQTAGYSVCNISYPSRKYSVEVLARDFVMPEIARCFPDQGVKINFVTHSMGGIIVRQLAVTGSLPNMGRVVMLSPPNQGSEVVDTLSRLWLFKCIGGPAGVTLGTGENAITRQLGPATFELGIITGNRSVNPFISLLLPGEDDGKVAVYSARLDGMKNFMSIPSSHPFIMKNTHAIQQKLHFLEHGNFQQTAS